VPSGRPDGPRAVPWALPPARGTVVARPGRHDGTARPGAGTARHGTPGRTGTADGHLYLCSTRIASVHASKCRETETQKKKKPETQTETTKNRPAAAPGDVARHTVHACVPLPSRVRRSRGIGIVTFDLLRCTQKCPKVYTAVPILALFSYENVLDFVNVSLLFVFNKYYLIIYLINII